MYTRQETVFFRIFDLHENHDENLTVEFIAAIREIFQMLLDHSLHCCVPMFKVRRQKWFILSETILRNMFETWQDANLL